MKSITRIALWRAYEKRCFYCSKPLEFRELEIDHVLARAERANNASLSELLIQLGLPLDFDLDSFWNLVPADYVCNRRKSDDRFSEATLRYYLEQIRTRLPKVKAWIEKLQKVERSSNALAKISIWYEEGIILRSDVYDLLTERAVQPGLTISEPFVICLGVNILDLQSSPEFPKEAPYHYPHLCDWLEADLFKTLNAHCSERVVRCEDSRNGEVFSIRFVSWTIDLDFLPQVLPSWWEILEVCSFSELYESSTDLFLEALSKSANSRLT